MVSYYLVISVNKANIRLRRDYYLIIKFSFVPHTVACDFVHLDLWFVDHHTWGSLENASFQRCQPTHCSAPKSAAVCHPNCLSTVTTPKQDDNLINRIASPDKPRKWSITWNEPQNECGEMLFLWQYFASLLMYVALINGLLCLGLESPSIMLIIKDNIHLQVISKF